MIIILLYNDYEIGNLPEKLKINIGGSHDIASLVISERYCMLLGSFQQFHYWRRMKPELRKNESKIIIIKKYI